MEEVLNIIPAPKISAESLGTASGRGRLNGKYILVVGGGQSENDFDPNPPVGNGRAVCILAAREGATVVVADRSAAAAQATVDLIEKEGIGHASVVVGDASVPQGCAQIVRDALLASGGVLDGLVIVIGVVGDAAKVAQTASARAEYWDRVMNLNLRAHYLLMQEAIPHIEKQPGGGSVVSLGSIAQYLPASNEPAYNASKAGLSILVKNAAWQFAPRVRVNTVVPGLIDTPMGRQAGTQIKGRNASAVPLSRQGSGWDIAYAVIWLLSGESSFVSAQDIVVDGGRVGVGSRGAKVPNAEVEVS
jgi:NAD(P)-dependent dehydrogenase (short-subunit alcohol dehydrogenase family)